MLSRLEFLAALPGLAVLKRLQPADPPDSDWFSDLEIWDRLDEYPLPTDADHAVHVEALESVVSGLERRYVYTRVMTYDEIAALFPTPESKQRVKNNMLRGIVEHLEAEYVGRVTKIDRAASAITVSWP